MSTKKVRYFYKRHIDTFNHRHKKWLQFFDRKLRFFARKNGNRRSGLLSRVSHQRRVKAAQWGPNLNLSHTQHSNNGKKKHLRLATERLCYFRTEVENRKSRPFITNSKQQLVSSALRKTNPISTY